MAKTAAKTQLENTNVNELLFSKFNQF